MPLTDTGMDKGFCSRIGLVISLFYICLILTSCGSGSGNYSEPSVTGPNPTTPTPAFSALFSAELPDCSSPPSNSVYLCKNNRMSTEDIIAVDVYLNSDAPVIGAAFDLLLDKSSVEVATKEDQSVDFNPPAPPQTDPYMWKNLFVALKDDTLIIGASRGRKLNPINGDIPVVTLKFKRPTGESPILFSNNSIIDETGLPLGIPKESWYGGYFTP